MARPWYPKYPDDYARKTAHLSFAEHGAYGLLMDHYYRTGSPLPNDHDALFRICRGRGEAERRALHRVVNTFFDIDGDVLRLPRADEEIARAQDIHEKRVKGGKCSAHARTHVEHKGAVRARAIQPHPQEQPQESESATVLEFVGSPSGKPKTNRGTRWPENRAVPPEWIADFLTGPHGVGWSTDALRRQAVMFENYWSAKTGAAATKTNWQRTFDNWCLNAKVNPNGIRPGTTGAFTRLAGKIDAARQDEAGRSDVHEG